MDAAKLLGIFLVYLGHFGADAGTLQSAIYTFHMPFFFLLSGFFAGRTAFGPALIKKRARQLLAPYFTLCLLMLAVWTAQNAWSFKQVLWQLLMVLWGNAYYDKTGIPAVGGRWFFTCLFVVCVVYSLLCRLLKNRLLRLAVCAALYFGLPYLLPYSFLSFPLLPWGIDAAMGYMVFYCLGDCLFPLFTRLAGASKSLRLALTAAFSLPVLWVYFLPLEHRLASWGVPAVWQVPIYFVVRAAMCVFFLLAAQWLPPLDFIRRCGQNTLLLCGAEQLIRLVLSLYPALFNISGPVGCMLTTLLMLAVGVYLAVPLLGRFFPFLQPARPKLPPA